MIQKTMPVLDDTGKNTKINNINNNINQSTCQSNSSVYISNIDEQFTFTEFTKKDGILTKKISFDINGNLQKDSSDCYMASGSARKITLNLSEFPDYLSKTQRHQAIGHGVCEHEHINILSGKKFQNQTDTITRSKKNKHGGYFYYEHKPTLAMVDYDPEDCQPQLDYKDVISIIDSVCTGFAKIAKVLTFSTSSCIYFKNEELRGKSAGFHLYFLVQDGTDLPRFKELLSKRLWIKGYGYIKISRAGAMLSRTVFDEAVFSPERLDFVAGAELTDGLVQKRPWPEYISGSLPCLDTSNFSSLTLLENNQFKKALETAQSEAKPRQFKIQTEYINKESIKLIKESKKKGIELSDDEAKKTVTARCTGGEHRDLYKTDILYFDKWGAKTVHEIMQNPKKYEGSSLYDPQEPELGRGKAKLYFNHKEKKPCIHSFVHGGIKYFLHNITVDEGRQKDKEKRLLDVYINKAKENTVKEEDKNKKDLIKEASTTLDNAIIAHETDGGALYKEYVLDAYSFLEKTDLSASHKYRALLKGLKSLGITEYEKAVKAQKYIKKYGKEGESDSVINFFNSKHAGVMIGGQFRIINEIIDPVFKTPDITLSSIFDFNNRYANKKMPNPNNPEKTINQSHHWLEHVDRSDYEGIVFEPSGASDNYYNLWQGFAMTPKHGDWSLMQWHIDNIIADGNKERAKYIMAWFAHQLQNPGNKTGTMLVLLGGQGTGKNMLFEHFGYILGKHFVEVTQIAHVTGKFNDHLKACLLFFINEATWGGDKQGSGVLKSLATDPTIRVEPKGKDSYAVANHLNICVASNNEWVIPAELDERRSYVCQISEEKKQDYEYFGALDKQMKNGGREAMMHDFMHMDISNINLREIERTDALLGQILKGMSPIQEYWFERLKDGYLLSEKIDESGNLIRQAYDWDVPIIGKDMYIDFLDYCAGRSLKAFTSNTTFWNYLKKIYPKLPDNKQITINGRRGYYRKIPPLNECRAVFADILKMPVSELFKD